MLLLALKTQKKHPEDLPPTVPDLPPPLPKNDTKSHKCMHVFKLKNGSYDSICFHSLKTFHIIGRMAARHSENTLGL